MKRPKARGFSPTRKPSNAGAKRRERDPGEICHGTVGWEDGQDHFDLEDEGVALLKVTLFAGHNPDTQGATPDPSRAAGRQVLVRYDPTAGRIPPDGAHVIVARPAGMAEGPGSFFLLGVTAPDPKWIPNRKSNETVVYGPNDSFLRINEQGTIFGFCKSGDSETDKPVQFELSRKGFRVDHPYGRFRTDRNGWEMQHASGAKVSAGSCGGLPAPLDAFSSFVNLEAAIVRIKSAAVSLGGDGFADNALKATSAFGALDAMQAALAAVATALTAVGADLLTLFAPLAPTVPTATIPIGNAVTAVGASGSGLATAHIHAPTRSVRMS